LRRQLLEFHPRRHLPVLPKPPLLLPQHGLQRLPQGQSALGRRGSLTFRSAESLLIAVLVLWCICISVIFLYDLCVNNVWVGVFGCCAGLCTFSSLRFVDLLAHLLSFSPQLLYCRF